MTKTKALAKLYEALTGETLPKDANSQAKIINKLAEYYEEAND